MKQIEHCDKPNCPECNLKAYNAGYKKGQEEERQFILNILDGVDIADEQMGNKGGGTKAIRFALQNRIIN